MDIVKDFVLESNPARRIVLSVLPPPPIYSFAIVCSFHRRAIVLKTLCTNRLL